MNRNVGSGSGPGEITPDGCAVEFYALLPSFGQPQIVHDAVPAGAPVLELGCGTGRILRPLAHLGHPVLGVDESPAMLARIPDLPTICSPIETLRLDRTFGVVLLASTMINVDPALRREFLATCRHHLAGDGVAVFQQNPPSWFEEFGQAPPVRDDPGGVRRILRSARREPPRLHVEVEYQATRSGRTPGRAMRSARTNSPATSPRPGSGSAGGSPMITRGLRQCRDEVHHATAAARHLDLRGNRHPHRIGGERGDRGHHRHRPVRPDQVRVDLYTRGQPRAAGPRGPPPPGRF